ncbi:MAG: hypothetical protein HQ508_04265 [Candidatus Marinimicrobia bacterium]|nr:hypothetical protein [Candidatus Neomarinimicrobiota bacterium]
MLVAVLMTFLIFSFTGVAVLNISFLSSSTSKETVANIKMQYAMESSINLALWRINTGADSLVNYQADGVGTVWDANTKILSVNVTRFQREAGVILDLSDDTHFNRAIAAKDEIVLNGYDPGVDDATQIRSNFDFMPEVDIQYFLDNATAIHGDVGKTWKNNTFPNGIHVFTGNYITIDNIRLNSGTMVFTGHHVTFKDDNRIIAAPADSAAAMAAVIFTHPNQNFELYSPNGGETIIGAIYCAGDVELINGTVSGPVIGKTVTLAANFNFLDAENVNHYKWTHGFGAREKYDWPKQIGRWRTSKWQKYAGNG